jgi:hypothetical protein
MVEVNALARLFWLTDLSETCQAGLEGFPADGPSLETPMGTLQGHLEQLARLNKRKRRLHLTPWAIWAF